ncbi:response regulator [uncultured Sphingomonas sp.]|uniref:response regulator n=1 Tax=uncultured Sphingomonas sp. TaxID=158754 RepID=UPI0025FBA830|nr:response regulator [uncultured Sphingomonas sp.]
MAIRPPLRLLYVDDEPDLVAVVLRALKLDGAMQVRAVNSGAEALSVIVQPGERPDVVLLDVMMPDLDGPGTLERIRQITDGELPVIFFTARARNNELVELAQHGAIGVLTKPFDPLTLATDIRRLYDKSQSVK